MQHHTDEQKLPIGKALGRIPSGVFVLTAAHDGERMAMLASWVQQAAFEPPAISIAIAKGRPIAKLIRQSGLLAVSIVPENDKSLMKRYARGVKDGEDPFAGVAVSQSPAGVPILSGALGWIEAKLIQTCDFGADHEILVGQVTAAQLLRDGTAFTHQRGNGFHY
ncbi:MAG: flavin reductase [Anaerolineae bacterium]|nr:flavin reductase [Phycisphaerae bacterium]